MRRAGSFALLLLAFFLWRLGDQTGPIFGEGVTLHCAVPLTAADYDDMTRREARTGNPAPLALWTQKEHQKVSNGGRETNVAAVLVRGESRLLFPSALAEDDIEGVLVDKATSIALLGSKDTVGAEIECMGRQRVIRAVIDVPLPTVVLMVGDADSTPLENVSSRNADQWEAFALRHGLDVALAVKNDTWTELADLFRSLPVICLFAWSFVVLSGVAIRCRYPVRRTLLLLGLLILATVAILLLLFNLPQRWIPPNWSDFSFWSEAVNACKHETMKLFAAKIYRPNLRMFAQAGRAAGLELLSFIVLLTALKVHPH